MAQVRRRLACGEPGLLERLRRLGRHRGMVLAGLLALAGPAVADSPAASPSPPPVTLPSPAPPWLPEVRGPLVVLGLVLLATALGLELRRRWPPGTP